MKVKSLFAVFSGLVTMALSWSSASKVGHVETLSSVDSLAVEQELGKKLFYDQNLSNPKGQSCATCHAPETAFSDPVKLSVSIGAMNQTGTRNAPSLSYASFSPKFYFNKDKGTYVGGQFWDGRAKDLYEQATMPLLNHMEMNNRDKRAVVEQVRKSEYHRLLIKLHGKDAFTNVDRAFTWIAEAIEAYEKTAEFHRFSSKFDAVQRGESQFTKEEAWGLKLFNDPKKGNCAACHPSTADSKYGEILFTDFTYDNLGVPKSGNTTVDLGLGATVERSSENGKFKVPTLRNVALTAPYFHNGSFATLDDVIEFYNNRDHGNFGVAEVSGNVNREELGNLGLTAAEMHALKAFLLTLTDGWVE